MLTSTFIFNSFIVFYVLCAIFHCTLFFIMLDHELTHFTFKVSHFTFTIFLKVIPTSVLKFGSEVGMDRSGLVGTEVGIEPSWHWYV